MAVKGARVMAKSRSKLSPEGQALQTMLADLDCVHDYSFGRGFNTPELRWYCDRCSCWHWLKDASDNVGDLPASWHRML
jgi:hypothetical protein